MDFVSKALGSLNMGLPFALGAQIESITDQPWKLYDATLKKDGSKASVFEYPETYEASAQNAVAALRKLKLPGVVNYIETVKSGKFVYVVTERVQPLGAQLSVDARKFVLYTVLQTLGTMQTVAKCRHNSVCPSTLLLSAATGRPVLVGFDLATLDGLSVPSYAPLFNNVPTPPGEGWASPTLDTYQFGQLVANFLPEEARLISSLKSTKRPPIAKLASSNSAQLVLKTAITDLVDEIGQTALLAPHDLTKLCEAIEQLAPSLYPSLIERTILPELLRTNSPAVLRTNLVLISSLSSSDAAGATTLKVLSADEPPVQYIVKEFQSMDRVVRLELLRFLPQYISLLPDRTVQQNIMTKMLFGFGDNEVLVRKASVAAVEYLADKLTTRQLNSELLRLLAKTHNDVDPDVRALTTTVLCRLAPRLENRSVISTALGRALRDPVPKCRSAALRGISSIDVPAREVAEKLLGPAASGMLDKDETLSSEAWRITDMLLDRIRAESTTKGPSAESAQTDHDAKPLEHMPQFARMQTPDAPSAVPTPLSTLRRAPAQHHRPSQETEDQIEVKEAGSWGWEGEEDKLETTGASSEAVDDAWGWDDQDNEAAVEGGGSDIDEDAWGW